jgi:DNA-binding transcriptional regulator GbsR (MarR family)
VHKNLVQIQEAMVENLRNNLKVLDISDPRPVILAVLALAEKPLIEEEIVTRTHLGASDVRKRIGAMLDKNLLVKDSAHASGRVAYELRPDIDRIVAAEIRSKLEAVRSNTQSRVAECESLLESARTEFDDYDRLMAKYLGERVCKLRLMTGFMAKQASLLRLLEPGHEGIEEIKKISVT